MEIKNEFMNNNQNLINGLAIIRRKKMRENKNKFLNNSQNLINAHAK